MSDLQETAARQDRLTTSMNVDRANRTGEEQLTLRSQISDLAMVPPWVEHLASHYGISEETQYAMNLCLEEVLSNIIRHGYSNNPDCRIIVRYQSSQDKSSLLVVDDEAPLFNPLAADEMPVEDTLSGTRIGGLGIPLLRSFATRLEYEPTPAGNRLSMGFPAAR
jgi:anti-sigma regulatory factor (Ser/Thr protein kinase)